MERFELNNGLFYCPVCGKKTAVWCCDYDFEDYCMEGDGIVHTYHCSKCNSDIEAAERFSDE